MSNPVKLNLELTLGTNIYLCDGWQKCSEDIQKRLLRTNQSIRPDHIYRECLAMLQLDEIVSAEELNVATELNSVYTEIYLHGLDINSKEGLDKLLHDLGECAVDSSALCHSKYAGVLPKWDIDSALEGMFAFDKSDFDPLVKGVLVAWFYIMLRHLTGVNECVGRLLMFNSWRHNNLGRLLQLPISKMLLQTQGRYYRNTDLSHKLHVFNEGPGVDCTPFVGYMLSCINSALDSKIALDYDMTLVESKFYTTLRKGVFDLSVSVDRVMQQLKVPKETANDLISNFVSYGFLNELSSDSFEPALL